MKRWLLIFALLPVLAHAQTGCPYSAGPTFCGGTKISGTSLVSCTAGTDPDCIEACCGIPNNLASAGAPNGNIASHLAYSANSATPGIIINQRQRAWDVYLANGQTAFNTGGKCVAFIQGGAGVSTVVNAPMILPTNGGACPQPNGTPSTFWQITDPNHNNNTTQGVKVFNINYGVSAQGTVTGSGGGGSILVGDTSLTVSVLANRYWPDNTEGSGGNTFQIQVETELMTVTTQTGASTKGASGTVSKTVTVTRSSPAAHAANLNGWALTSVANGSVSSNSPLDLWDAACAFASMIHNGYCTSIFPFGESHGGEMALILANSTTAQRAAWLSAGNCEYSETNWGISKVDAIEPPTDQQAVAVLATDGTQPSSNAASFGGVSGAPSGAINTNAALWGAYSTTGDGCTGSATYSRTSTTTLGTYAYDISPIDNLPLTVSAAVSVGLSDTDVCTAIVQNYATAASIPIVTVTGSHGGDLGLCNQAWNPGSKMLEQMLQLFDIPDCTFGICLGSQATSGMQATAGVQIQ